ncbi:hypothetical protein [Sagittula stellata]|uniref:Tox-WTIP domain-containing protein n=1 Tax=Sagittula stellata (strain ATCC 700073 / DSM 11524 / E-37) TaxID=388399 RepID=A3K2H5_SAGS3|nr:hypothetical protein [Sagittula stellata]EBA08384.1 hypothetical protein SSE37_16268 [Sagittula stellata E-37]
MLRRVIEELVSRDKRLHGGGGTHGLEHRFREQINGQNGPGTSSWDTHDRAIRNQQRGLRRRLEEWEANRCGPPPPGAWRWATRPAPQPSEWVNPNPGPSAAQYAAGGVAAVGVGYLLYRGVRMLPSLFPPLWPSIPANLAIP